MICWRIAFLRGSNPEKPPHKNKSLNYALRLEQEVLALFKIQPVSIAQMEALQAPLRQRARPARRKKTK